MFNKLESYLMTVATKLSSNKVLIAVRDGFLITTPLIIVASIFLLIANFPIPNWSEFWSRFLGVGWEEWFTNVSRAVFNTVGLFTCLGTAYAYGKQRNTDAIQAAVVALVGFFILTPTKIIVDAIKEPVDGALDMNYLGTTSCIYCCICILLC